MFQTKDEIRKTEEKNYIRIYTGNEVFTTENNFRAFVYPVTNFVFRSF